MHDLSDNEDESTHSNSDNAEIPSGASPTEATPEQSPETIQARKDYVRRYHGLMELLTTEVGYLLDLRVLVTVSRPFGYPTPDDLSFHQIYFYHLSALTPGSPT